MSIVASIHHRAAISGYVRDAVSGERIAGVVVKLVAQNRETRTSADGFYYFLDLDDGAYALHADAPAFGSRYGGVTVAGVAVGSDAEGRPLFDPKGNLALPPTRLTGVVRRSDTLVPIAYADIHLRASNVLAKSGKTGQYAMTGVEAGTQTVQVSASGFTTHSQTVSLNVGRETVVGFSLTPS